MFDVRQIVGGGNVEIQEKNKSGFLKNFFKKNQDEAISLEEAFKARLEKEEPLTEPVQPEPGPKDSPMESKTTSAPKKQSALTTASKENCSSKNNLSKSSDGDDTNSGDGIISQIFPGLALLVIVDLFPIILIVVIILAILNRFL